MTRARPFAVVIASMCALAGCTSVDGTGTGPAGDRTTSTSLVAETSPPVTGTTVPSTTSTGPTVTTEGPEEILCEQPFLEPDADDLVVTLYQICDAGAGIGNRVLSGLQPVERPIEATGGPLRAAMEGLLAGPTPEETAAGFGSWFSAETAGALLDASVTSSGSATIDLDGDVIRGLSNVSTSTGGSCFRGQLYGTALAFDEISAVVFEIDGSATGFCGSMELIPDCVPVSEDEWHATYIHELES